MGVWLARWLGIPHLYDMHSSLPQQLSNFKYSKSGVLHAGVRLGRGPDGARLAVVITICQELQDTVDGHGRRRPGAADRERDGRRCRGRAVAGRRPTCGPRGASPADAPLALYTGTFEAYQGVRPADRRRGASWRGRIRTRACWWSAASRSRSTTARGRARDARRGRRDGVHRPAAGARDSRRSCRRATCSCRRASAARTRR